MASTIAGAVGTRSRRDGFARWIVVSQILNSLFGSSGLMR
jgi:hypothetical protein